jgi:2-amino-4-hydroxy-6-hydroxymethyldihydropteridine diphosphokinase
MSSSFKKPVLVSLGLGSNRGDRIHMLSQALRFLQKDYPDLHFLRCSSYFETAPWGPIAQQAFINACALFECAYTPQDLLAICLEVERKLGRIRDQKWGPREIDIDILTYGNLCLNTPPLQIPHPYLLERAFVLVPLVEIAPDLEVGGTHIQEAVRGCDKTGIQRI